MNERKIADKIIREWASKQKWFKDARQQYAEDKELRTLRANAMAARSAEWEGQPPLVQRSICKMIRNEIAKLNKEELIPISKSFLDKIKAEMEAKIRAELEAQIRAEYEAASKEVKPE